MNRTNIFTLLFLIFALSFNIECKRKNNIPYSRPKTEYGNGRLTEMNVHVSGNCQANGECPVGYTCTNQMCVKPVTKTNYRAWKLLQCNDTEKDCTKFQKYCHDSAYLDVLRSRCKRTCGHCPRSE